MTAELAQIQGIDLRQIVRDVRRANPTVYNDKDIAELVLAYIPGYLRAEALQQTLPVYIDRFLSEERSQSPLSPRSIASPGRSAKVAAIRDGWQRGLQVLVHVGPGQRLPFGECEQSHLEFAATELDTLADRCAAKARAYREFLRLLDEHGAQRVRDLPAEVLMFALGSQ
ncbi:MAG TPA: hypothetical protein VIV12_02120 [Streptosporangiaceae bacterium]